MDNENHEELISSLERLHYTVESCEEALRDINGATRNCDVRLMYIMWVGAFILVMSALFS